MTVPALGTVRYGTPPNHWEFSAYMTSHISARPKMDEANRTVTYWEYTIEINDKIQAPEGGVVDTQIDLMRHFLMVPGREFRYANHGFGLTSMNINVPGGTITDAAWGPTPLGFEFTPLGNQGALVTWRVQVNIPACLADSQTKYINRLAAWNYGVNWSIDESGLTTRTITGYIEIPMTRQTGSDKVYDTADSYRYKTRPGTIYGFRRTSNFTLSKDKRRLDFTYTDTELIAPLPDGVAHWTASHSVESGMNDGFNIWNGTIEATIEMAKDKAKGEAFNRFMILVQSRLGTANAANGQNNQKAAVMNAAEKPRGGKPGTILPTKFSAREELNSRTSHFSFAYQMIGVSFGDLITVSGLWTPVPGTDYTTWGISMATMFGVRGFAGMGEKAGEDILINLCDPTPPPREAKQLKKIEKKTKKKEVQDIDERAAPAGVGNFVHGWLKWNNDIQMHEKNRVIVHVPLGGDNAQPVVAATQAALAAGAGAVDATPGGQQPSATSVALNHLQRIAGPNGIIRMIGSGVRAAGRVPIPRIQSVAGIPVVQGECVSSEKIIGASLAGMPIYQTTWNITYYLAKMPTTAIEAASNPAFAAGGGAASVNLGS